MPPNQSLFCFAGCQGKLVYLGSIPDEITQQANLVKVINKIKYQRSLRHRIARGATMFSRIVLELQQNLIDLDRVLAANVKQKSQFPHHKLDSILRTKK